jgi:chemotaxis protein methyltransferase CheR
MRFHGDTLRLPDGTFGLLRSLICERTGAFYDDGKEELLLNKLAGLVMERGFDSFLDDYYLLRYEGSEEEWSRVVDAISVHESYFWREMDQVRALVDVLVPAHFAERPGEPLQIWSIPCAGGEEPLTIAMALAEAGWLERAPVQIRASDLSAAALRRATRGFYSQRAFRSLPPRLRERYFTQQNGGWRVAAELQARIQWSRINLVAREEAAPLASSRIIFCRNAFIYFAPAAIQRTVECFAQNMPSPGYLAVGAAESLLRCTSDFEFQEIGGAFFYVKH